MLKMWNMKTESLPVWAPHPLSHESSACCIFTPFLSLSHPTSWWTHMSSWHPAATPPHWRHWFSAIRAPPLPYSPGSLLWVPLHTDLLCETAAQPLHSAHFTSTLTEERTIDGQDKDHGSVSFFSEVACSQMTVMCWKLHKLISGHSGHCVRELVCLQPALLQTGRFMSWIFARTTFFQKRS